MAPIALIIMGITIYYLNNYRGYHIGIRGLPGLDAPSLFLILGAVALLIRLEMRRRARDRAERRKRGEF